MNFRAMIILVVIILLVSSCGPSEEALQSTISAGIQDGVRKTLTAIPTQTPNPTHTPYPTFTAIPSRTPTPDPVSDRLREQIYIFLQDSSAITAATSEGTSYADLDAKVSQALGSFELMAAMWPESLSREPLELILLAFHGWDLGLHLKRLEINDSDHPYFPDGNRFGEYVGYTNFLKLDSYAGNYIKRDLRGLLYVPFNNVSILLSEARNYYIKGQDLLLWLLDQ